MICTTVRHQFCIINYGVFEVNICRVNNPNYG